MLSICKKGSYIDSCSLHSYGKKLQESTEDPHNLEDNFNCITFKQSNNKMFNNYIQLSFNSVNLETPVWAAKLHI